MIGLYESHTPRDKEEKRKAERNGEVEDGFKKKKGWQRPGIEEGRQNGVKNDSKAGRKQKEKLYKRQNKTKTELKGTSL